MSGLDAASAGRPAGVGDEEYDNARRRMLAHVALNEHLAAPVEAPRLAAQILSRLCDDILALALYLRMPDGSFNLLSDAGFAGPPPRRAASVADIHTPALAELADLCGARRLLPLGTRRSAWIGEGVAALAALPFADDGPGGRHGLVLFGLRTAIHDPSLAALLDLGTLSIARAISQRSDQSEPLLEGPSMAAGLEVRTRVLLIDDEDLLVAHVRRILQRAGFEFHAAQTARGGFELATRIRPDVILMDKVMPDLDGTELLRLMRMNELLSTVPVIMLSGHADEAARVAALGEGADDFVVKPFSARELVARTEANVRLVRLRRDAIWRQAELLRLRQSQQELRTLLDTVQKVRDDERRMLAREVHDQLGQMLTAAKIDIRLLQTRLADPAQHTTTEEISKELGAALASVDEAIASVQNISVLLRPPALEEGGLVAALRWQAADLQRRARIATSVQYDPTGYVEPTPFVAGEMLRMCQEALTNILRHAGATGVVLQVVMRGSYLVVRICDNGGGIPMEKQRDPASFGLRGMRERAASIRAYIRIRGVAGRGTLVAIRRRLAFG